MQEGEPSPAAFFRIPREPDVSATLSVFPGARADRSYDEPARYVRRDTQIAEAATHRRIALRIVMIARLRRQGMPARFVAGSISNRAIYCHLLSVPPGSVAIGPGAASLLAGHGGSANATANSNVAD